MIANIARALAAFQRTLVSFDAPYDRALRGESAAMSASALRGEALFSSERFQCFRCHVPPFFTSAVDHEGLAAPDVRFCNNGLYNSDGTGGYPPSNEGVSAHTGRASRPGPLPGAHAAQPRGHGPLHARWQPGNARARARPLCGRRSNHRVGPVSGHRSAASQQEPFRERVRSYSRKEGRFDRVLGSAHRFHVPHRSRFRRSLASRRRSRVAAGRRRTRVARAPHGWGALSMLRRG